MPWPGSLPVETASSEWLRSTNKSPHFDKCCAQNREPNSTRLHTRMLPRAHQPWTPAHRPPGPSARHLHVLLQCSCPYSSEIYLFTTGLASAHIASYLKLHAHLPPAPLSANQI